MKKLIVTLLVLFLATGCVNVNKSSIDEIISTAVNSKYNLTNEFSKGYKYYLPRELNTKKQNNFNEIISSKNHDYYLYVDLVSYVNKIPNAYQEDKSKFISKIFKKGEIEGIINVDCNELECISTMNYNYATIQSKFTLKDINEVIDNSIIIASSIKYNDFIIKEILESTKFSSPEEQIVIFEQKQSDLGILDIIDDDDLEEDKDYDPDFLN